jgi:hypothetical protein
MRVTRDRSPKGRIHSVAPSGEPFGSAPKGKRKFSRDQAVADLTVEASVRSDDQAGISETIGAILAGC